MQSGIPNNNINPFKPDITLRVVKFCFIPQVFLYIHIPSQATYANYFFED